MLLEKGKCVRCSSLGMPKGGDAHALASFCLAPRNTLSAATKTGSSGRVPCRVGNGKTALNFVGDVPGLLLVELGLGLPGQVSGALLMQRRHDAADGAVLRVLSLPAAHGSCQTLVLRAGLCRLGWG